jgi:hypothetical protein
MTIKALYPNTRPTLNLDFAKAKALDPRVTFTRASTATFAGADGLIQTAASGAARFDHNPTTGESLGLLVEEDRTNYAYPSILPASNTGRWEFNGLNVTTNAGTAPDGTNTASLINLAAGSGNNRAYVYGGTVQEKTYSFYVKSNASGTVLAVSLMDQYVGGTKNITYTFSTGTFAGLGNVVAGQQQLLNGWIRLTLTVVPNGAAHYISFNQNSLGTGQYFLWGFQEELASFPTSYIPTTTATVTRAADVASMTGTNFSSWYNSNAGVFFANYKRGPGPLMGIVTGLPNEYSWTAIADEKSRGFTSRFNNVENFDNLSISTNATIKQIGAYSVALNQSSLCVNGRTVVNASHSQTDPTGIKIGGTQNSNYLALNSSIARLVYYPVRLPDAQLQALTAT